MPLVLFSGGVDSMALGCKALEEHKEKTSIMHFVYSHPALLEEHQTTYKWASLKRHDEYFHVFYEKLDIDAESLFAGKKERGPRAVPCRNDCFVTYAANKALRYQLGNVWIGVTKEDRQYPDCTPEWVELQNKLLKPWGVQLEAPFIDMTRKEIRALAEKRGWNLSTAWSCYEPIDGKPCGECDACLQG
jgi:7-cyano-7-deazaguanine synthase in queuosine biosynthesis